MNQETIISVVSLCVYDTIDALDIFESTSCVFRLIGGTSFGYRYSAVKDLENPNLLDRAFDILFEETLSRYGP
jgi:23S rRNA A1618 N6-methylase RlmF